MNRGLKKDQIVYTRLRVVYPEYEVPWGTTVVVVPVERDGSVSEPKTYMYLEPHHIITAGEARKLMEKNP